MILTKEGFWNKVEISNPIAFQQFLRWIDEYKENNAWDILFHTNTKFHHLPIAMQWGIFCQFVNEKMENNLEWRSKVSCLIEEWFKN